MMEEEGDGFEDPDALNGDQNMDGSGDRDEDEGEQGVSLT